MRTAISYMLAGITGPSGAGKSVAVIEFALRGFVVIDADRVARDVVMPGEPLLDKLAGRFGKEIILPDGTLDRKLLAARAFSSPENTETLNGIMHGSILARMNAMAEEASGAGRNCLFDAPLLIESGLYRSCDVCIAVIAPVELRIGRLLQRDCISEDEIRARMSRQHDDEFYTSRCEYVIVNDGDIDSFRKKAANIAEEILLHCKT